MDVTSTGASPSERAAAGTEKILLVDDRSDELEATAALLRGRGYELVLATSSSEALARLRSEDLAVAVVDLAVLDPNGSGIAAAFRDEVTAAAVPVIFLSRDALDASVLARAFDLGATDCLPKPPDATTLIAKVESLARLTRRARWLAAHLEIKQRTIDDAPMGIGFATLPDTWVHVNPALVELTGLSTEELMTRSLLDVVHPGCVANLAAAFEQVISGRLSRHKGEFLIVRPDGTQVWTAITTSLVRSDQLYRLTLVEDISEHKAIEDERARVLRDLEGSVHARDNFLSLAAHELRHPLTPLMVQVTNLRSLAVQEGSRFPREVWAWLDRQLDPVERSVHRLHTLIETLLDVSRMTVGRHRLQLEDTDLTAVVREVVEDMRFDLERSGSTIDVRGDRPVIGRWDRKGIAQMVGHLLSNALKFGRGKPIEVEITSDDGWGRLAVADQGVGIAEADSARIFERFERGAPMRHFGGFGLGLWVVREILTAHAGRIQLQSELGRGSRFTIELPRQPPPTTASTPP